MFQRFTTLLVCGAGLVPTAFVAPAFGADLYAPPAFQNDPYAAYRHTQQNRWQGASLGLLITGGWGWVDDSPVAGDFDFTGTMFGVEAGYAWQVGQLVFGVAGDVSPVGHFDGDESVAGVGDFSGRMDFVASLRGKIGIADGPLMAYATGGVAWAHAELDAGPAGGPLTVSYDDDLAGWVAGGGLAFQVNRNVEIKAEVLYFNFDNAFDGPLVGDGVDLDLTTARVGVSYKF